MSCFWKDIIITLIPALIVAAVAIVTLKQFYSQKWWEKRAEVYYKISEDLSRLFFCVSEQYSNSLGEINLTDERLKELDIQHVIRLESLKMILAGGLFIVSGKIFKELETLMKNLDNDFHKEGEEPLAGYIGRNYEAIKKFRESFNSLVKKDLKIK